MTPSVIRNILVTCLSIAVIVVAVAAGIIINQQSWGYYNTETDPEKEDIYYAWVEGHRILNGENPYARILQSDMRNNDKYATYFPLFYLASAATQKMGPSEYKDWLHFWRVIFGACYFLIAALLFETCRRSGNLPLGLFGVIFWLCSRWSIFVIQVGHLDFLAILFLLLSLLLFPKRRNWSFVLLGISLALKQIGIIVAPLYLIWAFNERTTRHGAREISIAFGLVALVPLIASIPFLAWEPVSFLQSIAFSATRTAVTHNMAASMDAWLHLSGPVARVPMVLLFALAYWVAGTGKVGRHGSVLLVFAAFLEFNSVLFYQYFCWMLPFVVLAVNEWAGREPGVPKSSPVA